MSGSARSSNPRILSLIVVLHVLAGLVSAWATPVLEAPDEGFHVAVVQWLNQGNGLPVQDPDNPGDYQQEASQPPLYYLIGSALTFWIDVSDWDAHFVHNPRSRIGIPGTPHNVNDFKPVPAESGVARLAYALRAYSLALSIGTVIATWVLAGKLAPGNAPLQALATAVMAFNPKAVFINAAVNNDNLLMLLSTVVLIGCLDVMRQKMEDGGRPDRWPSSVLRLPASILGLGLLLGLAVLTKVSGLVLWPIAGLALVWQPAVHRDWPGLRRALGQGAVLAAVALAVSGWWFVRNWLLYGDLLGLEAMVAVAGVRPEGQSPVGLLATEWYGFYLSYWSVFGTFTVLANDGYHALVHGLSLLAAIGCGLSLVRTRGRLSPAAWLLLAFTVLTLVGVIRWTLQTPASQGRLLFGAIAPLSIGMAAGWLALVQHGGRRQTEDRGRLASSSSSTARLPSALAVGLSAVLVVASFIIPIVDVAPRYQAPAPLAGALPAYARPVNAVLGDGLELVAYAADPEPVAPGAGPRVTLYWRARQPLAYDDVLALAVLARGQPVGVLDTWPGRGLLPLTQMQPGRVYADEYTLPVGADTPVPSVLDLSVGVWRTRPEDRLPVIDGAGRPLAAAVVRVGRVVGPGLVLPEGDPVATFEHGIRLWAITRQGSGSDIDLLWDTTGAVPADYTLFAHALGADNRQIDQADGPPLAGYWPTSAWVPGRAWRESRRFGVPLERVRCVALGWYDPATGQRLAALDQRGDPLPDGALVVDLATGAVCPP